MRILTFLIIVMLASAGAASAQQYGAWQTTTTEDNGLIAGTVNEAGQMFAQGCWQRTCYWMLASTVGCEKDHEFPVLVNASSGVETVRLYCESGERQGRYY